MDPTPPLTPELAKRMGREADATFATWPEFEQLVALLAATGDDYKLLRMLHVLRPTGRPDDAEGVAAGTVSHGLRTMQRPQDDRAPFDAPAPAAPDPSAADVLHRAGFQPPTWTGLRAGVLAAGRDELERLRAALRGGLPSAAADEVLELIAARLDELDSPEGSRMLHGCAALGVEIQDLGSLAVELLPPDRMEPLLPGPIRAVPTLCCGGPRPAAAPHRPRPAGRRRPGPGRRPHAGADPQPPGRPGPARRQRRRVGRGGQRHRLPRRDGPLRLRLVRLRRGGPGVRRGPCRGRRALRVPGIAGIEWYRGQRRPLRIRRRGGSCWTRPHWTGCGSGRPAPSPRPAPAPPG
ncbi:hypothetical protein GCM10020218_101120 [Dactylosporangium vinaceum]